MINKMFTRVLLINKCIEHNRKTSICYIIHLENKRIEHILSTKLVQKGQPKLRHNIYHILIKVVDNKSSILSITFPSIKQHQSSNMLEFSNSIITSSSCLMPFNSFYTYPTMSSRYHIHIISSIPNSQSNSRLLSLPHHIHHLHLLLR